MNKHILKAAAIILVAALSMTGCGKGTEVENEVTTASEKLTLLPTSECGGFNGLTEVFQVEMLYDGLVEDYLEHFTFDGITFEGENTQIRFNATRIGEEYISDHHEEIGELFEECKEEALDDEINKRMPKFADVTSWFPSDVAFTIDDETQYFKINKVEMHPTTQAVDKDFIENILIPGAKENSFGSMVYSAGFSFWFFGDPTEANDDAVDLTYVEETIEEESTTEETETEETIVETVTAEKEDVQTEEYLFSEYLQKQENIWLEFNQEELKNGGYPNENTSVIGILITSPNGTCVEARTPLSNFGTWGELEKKSDKENKDMAKDFVSDISNYEMTLNMPENVKTELQKYILSPHRYTLTGVDVNEWRHIERYLVLAFESTTPSVKGEGAGNTHATNGGDEEFEYYVTQQNIEWDCGYSDNAKAGNTKIGNSYYALLSAKRSSAGVMALRVPEGTFIKCEPQGSPNVLWNPAGEIYPEKTIIKDTHYVSPADAGKRDWDYFDRGYKHEY